MGFVIRVVPGKAEAGSRNARTRPAPTTQPGAARARRPRPRACRTRP